MAPRILVVEDDSSIAGSLVKGLKREGFEVILAVDGASAVQQAYSADLMVLDLMLPELSGFEVLERLRGRSPAPVIVLTALTELDDRLRCFGLGADDYLPKPFFIEELVARVRSRLRIQAERPNRVVRWRDAAVDLDERRVTVGGSEVSFTQHELQILSYLLVRPGRAISREQLTEALPPHGEREERTIDSHIARIRRKLGPTAGGCIATVWGIGYRFDDKDNP